MFKKINTAKLLGLLIILVLVYFAFNLFDDNKRSKAFKEELVNIDTTLVNQIIISKGNEQLELKKEDNTWKVGIGENRFKNATNSSIKQLLGNLAMIKPSRIVARSDDKWKDYQVDSLGTRVQVFENGKPSLDIVLGRLQFVDQRKYYTYVRLFNDKDTYVADNFLAMSVNTSPDNFRNSQVLNVKKDSIQQISFNYADSSFVLEKNDGSWSIEGINTDSASTATFLSGLSYMNNSNFFDQELPTRDPDFVAIITENNGTSTSIEGWSEDNNVIIYSSANPSNPFKEKELSEKIFKNKAYFFTEK